MKKTISITILLLFLSINTMEATTKSCYHYAMDAAGQELMHYGGTWGDYEYLSVALEYYDMCMEAEGNISDPIFI